MEFDRYIPGNIIFSDRYSLKTTNGTYTQLIAGVTRTPGYQQGKGTKARFRTIRGLTQISRNVVVVADYDNHCLRKINRKTGETSLFSGSCGQPGYQDGLPGQFYYPWSVVPDKCNRKQLFVVDTQNNALRTVGLELRAVAAFLKYNWKSYMRYLSQDRNCDIFLPIGDRLISRISYKDKTATIVSGSPLSTGDFQDGLLTSLYQGPTDIIFIDVQTFLVTDRNNSKVKLVDLTAGSVSALQLCPRCLNQPWSMLVSGDSLYVGQIGGIHRFDSEYQ